MTQQDIRITINTAAETMLLLVNKFNKDGVAGISNLAIVMKGISHILADEIKEYNKENNVHQWVMRSGDTGEIWGMFNDLTEAIDAKMRYEQLDTIEGIYREDMYLITQEPIK